MKFLSFLILVISWTCIRPAAMLAILLTRASAALLRVVGFWIEFVEAVLDDPQPRGESTLADGELRG